ncbi:hypothetical protein ACU4HD_28780 [Cupriavidus basilensis]
MHHFCRAFVAAGWFSVPALRSFGCAPMIATTPASVELAQGGAAAHPIKLLAPALIQLDTGYTRQLAANSVWKRVGHVPQGEVYRPVGTIFTIEGPSGPRSLPGAQRQQAGGLLFAGEQNYSPLSTAVP